MSANLAPKHKNRQEEVLTVNFGLHISIVCPDCLHPTVITKREKKPREAVRHLRVICLDLICSRYSIHVHLLCACQFSLTLLL